MLLRLAAPLPGQRLGRVEDRSSRPHNSPKVTLAEIVEKILWLQKHHHFGPAKIAMYLARYHDVTIWYPSRRIAATRQKRSQTQRGLRPRSTAPSRVRHRRRNRCHQQHDHQRRARFSDS